MAGARSTWVMRAGFAPRLPGRPRRGPTSRTIDVFGRRLVRQADPVRPHDFAKKTLDPIVTFAGPPLEPRSIMHFDDPAASGDQPLVLQFAGDGIDGRPLHAEQAGQRFL